MASARSVLGFDYGLKRIGMATGQTITGTATPLITIVQHEDGSHWREIDDQVSRWRPDALLVGVPYMLDGSETEMGEITRRFGAQLGARFELPVHYVDETLSSFQAEEMLKEQTQLGQHNKAEVDRMAAAVIVQTWLNQQPD